jgi:glycosyltransferase involved in cell wall biosynthesis
VCVGWSGSPSTAANLQVIREPLRTISARDDVELRFMGAADFGLSEVRHTAVPWRADTEVAELRRFDIGLVPLPLTAWTPHKFYLKLVQYMALGIPAVATPLGSNPIVIEDGVNGFLAGDAAAWLSTLTRLIDDPGLRAAVGARAADTAHARYTLQANAERIIAAFRSAL